MPIVQYTRRFWVGLIYCVVLLASIPSAGRAADCLQVSILSPSPFLGNHEEVVRLSDGSFWQVQYEYNYMYEYYPSAQICPSIGKLIVNGKALNVVLMSRTPGVATNPRATSPAAAITVVLTESGCDYFVADGPGGYYLLEWYGGHSPSKGDTIAGRISGYGFKDVFYTSANRQGRVWVDDYLLSRGRAIEKFVDKCD